MWEAAAAAAASASVVCGNNEPTMFMAVQCGHVARALPHDRANRTARGGRGLVLGQRGAVGGTRRVQCRTMSCVDFLTITKRMFLPLLGAAYAPNASAEARYTTRVAYADCILDRGGKGGGGLSSTP